MSTEKIRAIAYTAIGALSVLCKFTQGSYNRDYAFHDIVSSLGNILLVAGLLLLTIGITKLLDLKAKEQEEIMKLYSSKEEE